MPSDKQSHESERQHEVIEKAFEEVEAVLRREGVEATDRFFSAKELTLLGVVTWGEALASIEGEYSGRLVLNALRLVSHCSLLLVG